MRCLGLSLSSIYYTMCPIIDVIQQNNYNYLACLEQQMLVSEIFGEIHSDPNTKDNYRPIPGYFYHVYTMVSSAD